MTGRQDARDFEAGVDHPLAAPACSGATSMGTDQIGELASSKHEEGRRSAIDTGTRAVYEGRRQQADGGAREPHPQGQSAAPL